MRSLPALLFAFILISCSNSSQSEAEQSRVAKDTTSPDQDFREIDFFEKNKTHFQTDTFAITGKSKAGGELIVYHSAETPFITFDFWMYGVMGKMHAVFFTDKQQHIKLVKKTEYDYDKPFTEPEYTIREKTDYIVFNNGKATAIYADNRKKKTINTYQTTQTGDSLQELFKELTEGIDLKKYTR